MESFIAYEIRNARGELVDETNNRIAALIYRNIFLPRGSVTKVRVTPLHVVQVTSRAQLEQIFANL